MNLKARSLRVIVDSLNLMLEEYTDQWGMRWKEERQFVEQLEVLMSKQLREQELRENGA